MYRLFCMSIILLALILTGCQEDQIAQKIQVNQQNSLPSPQVPSPTTSKSPMHFMSFENELRNDFAADIYIEKFRSDIDYQSSVLYFYYFDHGEITALRAILHATQLIKTQYPEMSNIVFHISKGNKTPNGVEMIPVLGTKGEVATYEGLGLASIRDEKLMNYVEANHNLTDDEVKQAIRKYFEVNLSEFDVSVLN